MKKIFLCIAVVVFMILVAVIIRSIDTTSQVQDAPDNQVEDEYAIYVLDDSTAYFLNEREVNGLSLEEGDLLYDTVNGCQTKTDEGIKVFLPNSDQTLEGISVIERSVYAIDSEPNNDDDPKNPMADPVNQGNASVGGGINADDFDIVEKEDSVLGSYTMYLIRD